ncbi:hypothetical protein OI18_03660 [Flavihumibacter solisilvae]|uniref:Cytochrome c domain-containing protein n=2 Tax=Flavihumibacter solisilvae TaxID=1349421 RepID=A0A0C1L6J1_9BACT|nr:hypothetical protein OI18_03660 [Flavihumibacter solisilvae]
MLVKCNQQPDNSLASQNDSMPEIKTEPVNLELSKLVPGNDNIQKEEVIVEWDDYFGQRKKYSAYPLVKILDTVLRNHHLDKENTIVIFDCIDGYKPSLPVSELYGNIQGYLVDASGPDSLPHKFQPYYLVWKGPMIEVKKYPWPYGLSGLQLVSANEMFKVIKPAGADKSTGFQLFYSNCLKCHSINKIGGKMGPELNVPKNITEYWTERDIVGFCRNPASYRYNSAMPPITNLSDKELAEIVSYLKYMKGHKTHAK